MLSRLRVLGVLLTVALTLSLSGCIKLRISLDVKPDEEVEVGLALGMTRQAKALVASSAKGEDPFDQMIQEWQKSEPDELLEDRSWQEGEYEWRGVFGSLGNVDDLKRFNFKGTQGLEFVRSFSLTRQEGATSDRYEVNAVIDPEPLWEDLESADQPNSPVRLRDALEVQFVVGLPGKMIETNGSQLGQDSRQVWTLKGNELLTIHAVSEIHK